ncbi:hypothetical protein GWK48_02455 [Metallosphaera tengchongensis]|uniref:Uncharacterized protein n=1 Tax=Metallosphaera tengchongensis TaxID=1532350 RepID=A0A6N0NT95_9CREN|nr:hypothetical protein [Metallosphaera tengchongensis]QKQ99404.1 hypothetical protein GWK48_02455 [Metallosphaera tengchongensis]
MKLTTLALISSGISVLQIVIGALIGLGYDLLILHGVVGAVLLVLSIIFAMSTKGVERRMSLGNAFLVIANGIIGAHLNSFLLIVHLIFALGVLSNFSVMYGMERGKS